MKSTNLGEVLFDGEEVKKGYLRFEDDDLAEVCYGDPPEGTTKGLIFPSFANAHTHIGDSFAYPAPRMSIERLVAPPTGYKHRALDSTAKAVKEKGMLGSLETMSSTGTSLFSDFREEGLQGVRMLKGLLLPHHPRTVLLGRPKTEGAPQEEVERLLETSDGIGMSSILDCPMDILKRLSTTARSKGRLFSIHLSESIREDVDQVLSLRPDFVIHATKASRDDLISLAESKVPVVVCPRSNEFFGNMIDIPSILASGVEVGIGTDNGMVCRPDMLEEIKAAYRISRAKGRIEALDVVLAATIRGRKILKADANTTQAAKEESDFAVVRVPGKDPLKELVTTVNAKDVLAVVLGGKVRRPVGWK